MAYLENEGEDEFKRSLANLSLILKVPQTSMGNKKRFIDTKITHLNLLQHKIREVHLKPICPTAIFQFLLVMNVHLK